MAWEHRKETNKLYYTRTERHGRGRKRIYFGCGPLAEIASLQDGLMRIAQEFRRRERAGCPASTTGPAPEAASSEQADPLPFADHDDEVVPVLHGLLEQDGPDFGHRPEGPGSDRDAQTTDEQATELAQHGLDPSPAQRIHPGQ